MVRSTCRVDLSRLDFGALHVLGMLVELTNDLTVVIEACCVKGMLYVNGLCSVYEPITSTSCI